MFSSRPLDRGDDVLLFAFSLVVFSPARADPSKVEAQCRDVGILESSRRAKNDFVVQGAATGRMRMAEHRDCRRILQLAIQRFEAPGGTVKIDVTKRFWIHGTLT